MYCVGYSSYIDHVNGLEINTKTWLVCG